MPVPVAAREGMAFPRTYAHAFSLDIRTPTLLVVTSGHFLTPSHKLTKGHRGRSTIQETRDKDMATKQQEKSQQTMQELMDSAIRLFGSKGFVSTSVAEITDNAGYAKGSFYRHWNSKDELFLQIIERKFKHYRAARHERIREAGNLEEAMNIIWDFLETILGDRDWSSIFLEFTVHSATNDSLRKLMNKSDYRLNNRVFADLVRDHMETDFPPEKIGALNTAMFEGYLIHRALGTRVLDLADVRRAAIDMALKNGTKRD